MSIDVVITNTNERYSLDKCSLLDLLREKGVRIRSSCGGHATCGDCVVKVKSGDKLLSAVNFEEKKLLGNVYYITKERLACQLGCGLKDREEEANGVVEFEIVNLD
tara:strand:- start:117 stop:434 length:318 start_codon:yes stop_codon:yes gene_type:complete